MRRIYLSFPFGRAAVLAYVAMCCLLGLVVLQVVGVGQPSTATYTLSTPSELALRTAEQTSTLREQMIVVQDRQSHVLDRVARLEAERDIFKNLMLTLFAGLIGQVLRSEAMYKKIKKD